MFTTFFRFELRYWLRTMMLYVFLSVVAVLTFFATSNDNVRIGSGVDNTFRNAPFVVQALYGAMAILTTVMVAAFVNSAASRDFSTNMHQIIFTKPIGKRPFLLGRFSGSTLIATIPMLGISVGMVLALLLPGIEPSDYGPILWSAHAASFLLFAVPNTILIAAIIFAIAVWTRSSMAAFIGAILVIVASGVSQQLIGNLDNDVLSALCDPFALEPFEYITRYWTVDEKNSQFIGWTGILRSTDQGIVRLTGPSFQWDYFRANPHRVMLANRLLWLSVGAVFLAAACFRFSFAERKSWSKKRSDAPPALTSTLVAIPHAQTHYGAASQWVRLWSQVRTDFFGIVKSGVFIVLMFAGLLNTIMGMVFAAGEGFGLHSLPVTYNMVALIRGALYIFLIATITFFAGVLVWKEREAKLDEVCDSLPQPTWVAFLAKLIALMMVVISVLAVGILSGIVVQACKGYSRFQIPLYATEILVIDMVWLFCLAVLALLCHVIVPNKYAGYFLFVILFIANIFGWNALQIQSNMVSFGSLPGHVYSDLYHFAPFTKGLFWFSLYWLSFAGLVCIVAIVLWRRGTSESLRERLFLAGKRLRGGVAAVGLVLLMAFTAVASWTYYNTEVVNTYRTPDETEELLANYEKKFKQYETLPQPRITKVNYTIDIFPQRRGLNLKGEQLIENKSEQPIDRVFVNMPDEEYETQLTIEGASLQEDFDQFDFRIYSFEPPMQPGDTRSMSYTMTYEPKGFENSVSNLSIVQNGTFFNNSIVPQIGYQSQAELTDKKDREEYDLPPKSAMPALDPDDLATRMNTYLSNNSDWVDVDTTISTSADQIAVAPGSLKKTWEENGRRYFHYQVDHPSKNFYSFISGKYKVATRQWNGVDIEVYYHPEHEWNVDNMLRSIRKSLEYYTEHFGPYEHGQARIIEFPRVASFAQAFPGTMPYSEGIGFIADIEKEDDIDMVYYVVAHEMAHQWWAHQVCGANMQGATVLSETLAQYSALMVMEHEYGRDMMRKFLQYEMRQYLGGRSRESLAEQPLAKVESQQGYIHYRKGSVVMYYLKEMIGEDKINEALKSLIKKFAYQGPPYPTSLDLIEALREVTPPEYQYLLSDLFDNITLFANRTAEASITERDDGRFDVTIKTECRKYQAGKDGKETEVPINDWIEIGALAKPASGKRFGATLHRELMHITKPDNTFTFTVDSKPELVGIDPFALLVDRLPDDNTKKPKVVASGS